MYIMEKNQSKYPPDLRSVTAKLKWTDYDKQNSLL